MTILIAGGAGYIGSHTVRTLLEAGEDVAVLDDLSEGHRETVPGGTPLIEVDLKDRAATLDALGEVAPEAVFNFAASCYVGESVEEPGKYYQQNLLTTLNLLEGMRQAGCGMFVLSSTCAVYGEPDRIPITEDLPKAPVNPYGRTKLYCEGALADYHRAHGMRSVSLRYFNAAGAHPSGELGEHHEPETHLIPLVLQVALGQRDSIKVFGSDYPTPDGTCIRDYIHVIDLAQAHVLGLKALREGRAEVAAFNLGNEQGHSVRQVIEEARRVTGHEIPAVDVERRAGDPPKLVGSSALAREELGWSPRYGDLGSILETAWNWHSKHPEGYA
ncbi:MAG: UDP-glucose 4-epimerase GalE [Planctomycetes bacterium]|jgi:UDP-glucose-4-epimerase GalE|nr:UDP-glucose 4-epimerase GalE [Planctomycetota bacterium]MDP6424923.1 UDP-glucose 4-epimerase GalE [Planctomycetota bacterium]